MTAGRHDLTGVALDLQINTMRPSYIGPCRASSTPICGVVLWWMKAEGSNRKGLAEPER